VESATHHDKRSVVEFYVSYDKGVYTTGRNKGQMQIGQGTITIIVFSTSNEVVFKYIQDYCDKWGLRLDRWEISNFSGKRQFEFTCERCSELTVNMSQMDQGFCSNICRDKKRF
jgi:hypothetical protein